MIILVACTDIELGIGDGNNELLFDFPKDKQHFKAVTTGQHVVMGRKTWDSLPVKPLPKRKNYVLTRDDSFEVAGRTKVFNSVDEVIELAKSRDVYVIGGGEIYEQLMPYADKLMLTHVHVIDHSAKVFFPNIDVREWGVAKGQKNEADKKNPHSFTFVTYNRVATAEEVAKRQAEKELEEKNQTQNITNKQDTE